MESVSRQVAFAQVRPGMHVQIEEDQPLYVVTRNIQAPDWSGERRVYFADGRGWLQGMPNLTVTVVDQPRQG